MAEQVDNPLSREASLKLATELERIGARLDASDSPRLSAEDREQLVSLAEDALASRSLYALGDDPVVQAVNDMPEAHQLAAMGVARALARHDAADAENPFQSARLAQVYSRERQYTAYLAERQERDGWPHRASDAELKAENKAMTEGAAQRGEMPSDGSIREPVYEADPGAGREASSARDPELVFQTTGSFIELEVVGANVPDDHMEFLLEHNAIVYGRNQDGLVVSVMTDMDFETPIATAITAAPYAPDLFVGHRGTGEVVLIEGAQLHDVVRSERFDAVKHLEHLEAACAHTLKSMDAEARQLAAELQEGGGISQTQAVTLVAHLRENGITFDADSSQWVVRSDAPGLSEALEDAGVQVAIRVAEGKGMAQEQNHDLVVHIESTGNAAFKDAGVGIELARLIEVAATKVREAGDNELDAPLFDLNGNRVGRVALVPEDETKQLQPKVGEAVAVVYASERDGMADMLARVADSIRSGAHAVSASEAHFEYNAPTLQNDHGIDMSKAFGEGRVFMADGIEAGAYRFVVTDYSFEPGYHQGEGDAWLVNALGEPASGYEDGPDTIREVNLRELRRDEKEALQKVIDRTWSLDDLERHLDGDEPELG
ncbi:TPA: hypothetical protein HH296_17820 [Xanthomonas vasicola pv. zeae]|uniref:hypothetical protein n=1 Tax=Xanthomonas TaxID=338 RepID=UPI000378C5FD|nr:MULTISPECIES: hypothetical protein [Xanthomonas]HHZ24253.1 hypothetical protein [Xanthomonas vasicola pv. zeae]HHZ28892.1 hypothetical protein [Xanthomonas vasicola pv. zeae]HHZ52659.1 hypothetical protein [Xanthomonas vasicola pv. zeae]